jgi:thiol-disulfide isomerase/thioredoxin
MMGETMSSRLRLLLGTFTVLAAVASAGMPRPASAADAGVAVGEALPDVMMAGLNGPDRSLSAYRGRPLLINVWASWCAPCREEAASLERLAWQPAAVQFTVIGISTDDYRERALRWLAASNATISHYLDHDLQLEKLLGASQLPLTVFVDSDGRVLARIYGAKQWDGPAARGLIDKTFSKPRQVSAR